MTNATALTILGDTRQITIEVKSDGVLIWIGKDENNPSPNKPDARTAKSLYVVPKAETFDEDFDLGQQACAHADVY
jgi:hypothetical protein